jgi:hypothetical protein
LPVHHLFELPGKVMKKNIIRVILSLAVAFSIKAEKPLTG